jgi:dCMP deaminase
LKHKYFLDLAKTVASASKDPSTKVGAVVVDSSNKIVSTGYNGFVMGCNESLMTFDRPMKYRLIIHAEANALLFAKQDLKNCKIYITDAPCDDCLKLILQSGIREVYYTNLGPMSVRGTEDQKKAVELLIQATGAVLTQVSE